jgi:diguanylate cyclase (GGDEF)-like protein
LAYTLTESDIADLFILRRVPPDAIIEVLGRCPVLLLKTSQILLRAGQSNQKLYMILSGRLAVYLEYPDGEPVAVLHHGETVGEMSVIDNSPTSAHVVSVEESRVLEVDEKAFWRMISLSHEFACNLLLMLSGRIRSSDDAIVRNIRLKKRFQRDAMVDILTGLYNRRWLDMQLPRLISRHLYSEIPLSVIMFDVDHFKNFNDRYGHDAGDDVLALVARITLLCIRPTDLSARYGGEEFLIMLAGIGADLALTVAERIRKAIAEERVITDDGRELSPLTVSLGVSELRKGDNADSLAKRADTAMYRAKESGRNRACLEE